MLDFPMAERLDDRICLIWVERYLHPDGLTCPSGHRPERRLFRPQGDFPAYRCRACDGYDTCLTHTACAKPRQRPATLVRLLRSMAKGEPTARLARELGRSRQPVHPRRHRVQANLNATAPTNVMRGTAVEADERYQNAGGKTHAPWPPERSATPPRQEAQGAWDLRS